MALIASYLLDEGSGTTVGDNQSSPTDLTISGAAAGTAWTSIAAGAGYDFNQTDQANSGNITSANKVWQTLNSTAYTVILVFRNDDQESTQAFWGVREDDFSESPLRCRINGTSAGGGNANTVRWFWTSQAAGEPYWQSAQNVITVGTVYAYAFVFNSDNATGADRCRVYEFPEGGVFARLTPVTFTEPSSGQVADFTGITDNAVWQMATVVGVQPFNGAFFYLGLWDEAIDETTLESYMEQLLADNDANPSDTPAEPAAFMPASAGDFFRARLR